MARYRIVPERSRLWIDARSSLHPIQAVTDGLEGYIEMDADGDGELTFGEPPVGQAVAGGRPPVVGQRARGPGAASAHRRQAVPDDRRRAHQRRAGRRHRPVPRERRPRVPRRGPRVRGRDAASRWSTTAPCDWRVESTFDIRDFGMEPPQDPAAEGRTAMWRCASRSSRSSRADQCR